MNDEIIKMKDCPNCFSKKVYGAHWFSNGIDTHYCFCSKCLFKSPEIINPLNWIEGTRNAIKSWNELNG